MKTVTLPPVELGTEKTSGKTIYINSHDRILSSCILGPIGSGKHAQLTIPIINQDLHHITHFINQYKKELTEHNSNNITGNFLNGITVISPDNNLCRRVFNLVQAHKIPESSVFYIDPTNPNTKGINILHGPVDKVAEVFAMAIKEIANSNDVFFQQSQINHIKNYVYLLKLHSPKRTATFDDISRMYEDVEHVRYMHKILKFRIDLLCEVVKSKTAPEERIKEYELAKEVDAWFDHTIQEKKDSEGKTVIHKSGKYQGQPMYYDNKAEHVKELYIMVKELSTNELIRRVLFEESTFDFNSHLEHGGVLLVNTAQDELGSLSNILGQFILLSLQQSVFQRKLGLSFHHLVVDGITNYIVEPFIELLKQARKYKLMITVTDESLSEISQRYTPEYLHSLIANFRNYIVFGGISSYDANIFSDLLYEVAGEKILTADEILAQDTYMYTASIVCDNRIQTIKQLKANFVEKDEFSTAIIQVNETAGQYWCDSRPGMSL
ncbi:MULTISPECIES: conjugal transfer protein TraG [Bacillales]|uniref:conjugal transfer protein TraG n=1 Tax=Bacillales TaxID=1385 RepID=UPI00190A582B|nr:MULTISPECIES: conjugal transfer protein TraG [Bacillales]WAI29681.1 MAG: conjugal transfer protein TraG [Bacillus paranthracis]MBK3313239.1 conjugal transfer protein TraG [Staphylococcus aureus]MDA2664517.1 conjugal transfer protein TraG [Bacillus cereus group sp. Bc032]MDA2675236.1 conjugal transfer protein TraG [Bacillus cereus group sp. Bc031]MDA2680654.1 conjugal transfer protein TraG [Bacillus cereus group sp. Bc029]